MKKIVTGKELQEKMALAVDILGNTVKTTLGPKGSNVIIDHSNFSPYITNDGVTIAENIESDDEVINTILELAKEASIKTNLNVGDGTTTTLVLLQKIFAMGLDYIKKGKNPIGLKNELKEELKEILFLVKKESRKPTSKDLRNIAIISSNDEEIGKIVADAYLKVRAKEAIAIKESEEKKTTVKYLKGYTFDSNLASIYFLESLKELVYAHPRFLIVNNTLNDLEDIALILNNVIKEKEPLVIIANLYSEEFIQDILVMNHDYHSQIILLKTPYYGLNSLYVLEDLALITSSTLKKDLKDLKLSDLGYSLQITVNSEEATINFADNAKIQKRIKDLKESNEDDIAKRIAMFKKGSIEISVGAETTTERREKKMRYDDALGAICCASRGIIGGSGLILSKISSLLSSSKESSIIFKEALKEPLKQIIFNSGANYDEIYTKIRESNFTKVYNVKTQQFEDIKDTLVLDPLEVVLNSLINATSIAGMLLTTTSLVINEYASKDNKNYEYYDN